MKTYTFIYTASLSLRMHANLYGFWIERLPLLARPLIYSTIPFYLPAWPSIPMYIFICTTKYIDVHISALLISQRNILCRGMSGVYGQFIVYVRERWYYYYTIAHDVHHAIVGSFMDVYSTLYLFIHARTSQRTTLRGPSHKLFHRDLQAGKELDLNRNHTGLIILRTRNAMRGFSPYASL